MTNAPAQDLSRDLAGRRFATVLADPPWRFVNRTGKVAPEHRRLSRYPTLTVDEICALPIADHLADTAHCYLWVPNALLPEGLQVLAAWGFPYKSNLVWHKVRKDGGSDGRGVGFYFRNVTEMILFGTRGKQRPDAAARPPPGEHARHPQARAFPQARRAVRPDRGLQPGPHLELFGRGTRRNWTVWGNQASDDYRPDWDTYAYNSGSLAAE